MDWREFNDQFRETEGEKRERWAATRAKRKAEGKCWQCGVRWKKPATRPEPKRTAKAVSRAAPGGTLPDRRAIRLHRQRAQ